MKAVKIAELKNRLSNYLNDVKEGEEILIKDRDRPIARIVPIKVDSPDEEMMSLAAQGKIRLGSGAVEEDFWKMPAPQIPDEVLRRVLEEERDDAR
jgi:prevent-host-death family protein